MNATERRAARPPLPRHRCRSALLALPVTLWLTLGLALAPDPAQAKGGLPPSALRVLRQASQQMDAQDYRAAQTTLAPLAKAEGPARATALLLLGNALHLDGRPAEAARAYEQGLALEPENLDMARNLAASLAAAEEFSRAAEVFLRAAELAAKGAGEAKAERGARADLLRNAAASLYRAGDYARCRTVLTRAKEALPEASEADAAAVRAARRDLDRLDIYACLALERWREAEGLLLAALKNDPGEAEDWRLLAQTRLGSEDWPGAACALETALALAPPSPPDHPERRGAAEDQRTLASLYQAANVPALAAQALEREYGARERGNARPGATGPDAPQGHDTDRNGAGRNGNGEAQKSPAQKSPDEKTANGKNADENGTDVFADIARTYARARRGDDALRAAALARTAGTGRSAATGTKAAADRPACLLRGRLLLDFGRAEAAREVLETCGRENPDLGEPDLLLGFAAWDRADWPSAAAHFRRAARVARAGDDNRLARQALEVVEPLANPESADRIADGADEPAAARNVEKTADRNADRTAKAPPDPADRSGASAAARRTAKN
ncbi:MAG: hypothetical protein H0S85_09205 [Desulfovibrionaceae bacterium]|jgi:cytochrome c-type biogenesis protein CcmH/NrfG|nr:hypothetical protein [Desulfovibrionaceae bacterium]